MPTLAAILADVEEELGADARAALAEQLTVDDLDQEIAVDADTGEAAIGNDALEAMEGELESGGAGQGKAEDGDGDVPEEALTEEELERRLDEIRADLEGAVTEDDVDEALEELRESAKAAIGEAVPGLVEDVGQKMAGVRRGAADYGAAIARGFSGGEVPDDGVSIDLDYDRPGAASGSGSGSSAPESTKANGQGEGRDYGEQIEGAFGSGAGEGGE